MHVVSAHVCRCGIEPTVAQPFEPTTCRRQPSAVAMTVPRYPLAPLVNVNSIDVVSSSP